MLPGFRFFVAAIVFSCSIIVFGLGAAALFRAAHEQFASNSSWRGAPEADFTAFLPQAEPSRPVIAMLRIEPVTLQSVSAASDTQTDATPDSQMPDNKAPELPAEAALPVQPALTEQAADADTHAMQVAAAAAPVDAEPAKVVPDVSVVPEAPIAAPVAASPQSDSGIVPAIFRPATATTETAELLQKLASVGTAPVTGMTRAASAPPPSAPKPDAIAIKLASLGNQPVASDQPAVTERRASLKTASIQLRKSLARKRVAKARLAKQQRLAEARRVRQRQAAQRARQTAAQQQQQLADPFAQQQGFGQQQAFGQPAAQSR